MAQIAEVITLYEQNAGDVAAMLREAADNIEKEAGEGFCPTRAMIAVQISDDEHVQVYGWGRTDTLHSIAALELGASFLKQRILSQHAE